MKAPSLHSLVLGSSIVLHILAFALIIHLAVPTTEIQPPAIVSMSLVNVAASPHHTSTPSSTKAEQKNKPSSRPNHSPPRPKPASTQAAKLLDSANESPYTTTTASPAQPSPAPSTAAGSNHDMEAASKKTAIAETAKVTEPLYRGAYLNNPKPQYPPLSIEENETGTVHLRVLISAQGLPQDVSLASSSGFSRLDRAALNAVKKWRFIPAKRGNEAIPYSYTIPVEFSLKSAKS
ncbi:energy transducer TonB [Neisseriaceae bacterium TC5R-5]|nr:energy transducer TonB [Neisseriaceae bacterium TC5R-5]